MNNVYNIIYASHSMDLKTLVHIVLILILVGFGVYIGLEKMGLT